MATKVNINSIPDYKNCTMKQFDAYMCIPQRGTIVINKLEQPNIVKQLGNKTYFTVDELNKLKESNPNMLNTLNQLVTQKSAYMTTDKTPVVICGTLGELSVESLDYLAIQYTFLINGQSAQITGQLLKSRMKNGFLDWTLIRHHVQAYNKMMALFVPVAQKGEIQSNRGTIQAFNQTGVSHGLGDFLVCYTMPNGLPNFANRWVVNGEVFANTFNNQGWTQNLKSSASANITIDKLPVLVNTSLVLQNRGIELSVFKQKCDTLMKELQKVYKFNIKSNTYENVKDYRGIALEVEFDGDCYVAKYEIEGNFSHTYSVKDRATGGTTEKTVTATETFVWFGCSVVHSDSAIAMTIRPKTDGLFLSGWAFPNNSNTKEDIWTCKVGIIKDINCAEEVKYFKKHSQGRDVFILNRSTKDDTIKEKALKCFINCQKLFAAKVKSLKECKDFNLDIAVEYPSQKTMGYYNFEKDSISYNGVGDCRSDINRLVGKDEKDNVYSRNYINPKDFWFTRLRINIVNKNDKSTSLRLHLYLIAFYREGDEDVGAKFTVDGMIFNNSVATNNPFSIIFNTVSTYYNLDVQDSSLSGTEFDPLVIGVKLNDSLVNLKSLNYLVDSICCNDTKKLVDFLHIKFDSVTFDKLVNKYGLFNNVKEIKPDSTIIMEANKVFDDTNAKYAIDKINDFVNKKLEVICSQVNNDSYRFFRGNPVLQEYFDANNATAKDLFVLAYKRWKHAQFDIHSYIYDESDKVTDYSISMYNSYTSVYYLDYKSDVLGDCVFIMLINDSITCKTGGTEADAIRILVIDSSDVSVYKNGYFTQMFLFDLKDSILSKSEQCESRMIENNRLCNTLVDYLKEFIADKENFKVFNNIKMPIARPDTVNPKSEYYIPFTYVFSLFFKCIYENFGVSKFNISKFFLMHPYSRIDLDSREDDIRFIIALKDSYFLSVNYTWNFCVMVRKNGEGKDLLHEDFTNKDLKELYDIEYAIDDDRDYIFLNSKYWDKLMETSAYKKIYKACSYFFKPRKPSIQDCRYIFENVLKKFEYTIESHSLKFLSPLEQNQDGTSCRCIINGDNDDKFMLIFKLDLSTDKWGINARGKSNHNVLDKTFIIADEDEKVTDKDSLDSDFSNQIEFFTMIMFDEICRCLKISIFRYFCTPTFLKSRLGGYFKHDMWLTDEDIKKAESLSTKNELRLEFSSLFDTKIGLSCDLDNLYVTYYNPAKKIKDKQVVLTRDSDSAISESDTYRLDKVESAVFDSIISHSTAQDGLKRYLATNRGVFKSVATKVIVTDNYVNVTASSGDLSVVDNGNGTYGLTATVQGGFYSDSIPNGSIVDVTEGTKKFANVSYYCDIH